jgi:hypothetical protein
MLESATFGRAVQSLPQAPQVETLANEAQPPSHDTWPDGQPASMGPASEPASPASPEPPSPESATSTSATSTSTEESASDASASDASAASEVLTGPVSAPESPTFGDVSVGKLAQAAPASVHQTRHKKAKTNLEALTAAPSLTSELRHPYRR